MGANKDNDSSRKIANRLNELNKTMAEISETLKVIAYNQLPTVATPVIALSSNKAAITCATSGAVIHYTTDGTEPTADSAVYSEPLSIAASPTTIKAIAMKLDCHDSAVASKVFTIVAKPVIGVNADTGKIEMSCATDGATIYYTDDDSDPTSASTAYSAALDQPAEETTYKAIAIKDGMVDSAIETFTFTPTQP
ncbi:MAG: chitobiase/beta-hexosaminidase C-terminal domain-containing protein [Bacteroidaceae bacterium]|nr:chitobiase/beta-hexosaminidase C-terminal domain-containing protein [Bacteroidaceae bacterium]MBR5159684.1 chitobiase/beta-hexosaminidase C-terminal domain-containing protein [Bacteroidaceae bacterium]